MTNRITDKYLNTLADRLNKLLNQSAAPFDSDTREWNVGNMHITHAYGGVSLAQIANNHGAIRHPLPTAPYHMPKRELAELLHAYMAGIELGLQRSKQP